jgi:hypothetical protein
MKNTDFLIFHSNWHKDGKNYQSFSVFQFNMSTRDKSKDTCWSPASILPDPGGPDRIWLESWEKKIIR